MGLGLGLASSYAPAMFREPGEWPKLHAWLTDGAPQPPELAQETPEVIRQHAARIDAGLGALRQQLEAYRPDVLVILASDTGRVFTGVQVPQISTFLGEEIWGSTRLAELGEQAEDDIVRLPCAAEVARFTHRELVERGFDLSYSEILRPLGQPEFGTTPSIVAPARGLLAGLDVPIVPIYVNTMVPPAPSGRRCYRFGRALVEVLSERRERVALFASGGLSHDYFGSRAGWIDAPFDEWVLDRITRGKGTALEPIFDLESDTLRGGSAQVRLWTMVAGACETLGSKATIVDYFPAYTAATGIGFAYWPLPAGA